MRYLFWIGLAVAMGCEPLPYPKTAETNADASAEPPSSEPVGEAPRSAELQIEDVVEGTGPPAKDGDTVLVHYTGTLTDGSKFDSSLDRGKPFELTIGVSGVIKGWTLGLVGMKAGGKRKLTIPPHLAYGIEGRPPIIPPSSTLLFDIEMIEIKAPE